jgi:hypothetical protein
MEGPENNMEEKMNRAEKNEHGRSGDRWHAESASNCQNDGDFDREEGQKESRET